MSRHLLVHSAVCMMALLCMRVCMCINWWRIVSDYVQSVPGCRNNVPSYSVRQWPLSGLPQHNHPMAVHTQDVFWDVIFFGYCYRGLPVSSHWSAHTPQLSLLLFALHFLCKPQTLWCGMHYKTSMCTLQKWVRAFDLSFNDLAQTPLDVGSAYSSSFVLLYTCICRLCTSIHPV